MPQENHECPEMKKAADIPTSGYGTAFTSIWRREGRHWVIGNGEYESGIFYCPCCGVRLPQENSNVS